MTNIRGRTRQVIYMCGKHCSHDTVIMHFSVHGKTIIYYTSDVCVTEEERKPWKMWAGIMCLFTASWCQFHSDKWNETCKNARHTRAHTHTHTHRHAHTHARTRAHRCVIIVIFCPTLFLTLSPAPAQRHDYNLLHQHQFAFWLYWSLLQLKSQLILTWWQGCAKKWNREFHFK